MNPEQRFAIEKDRVSWRVIDGEAVILNLDNGLYYDLNETGTVIWEAIAEGKTFRQVLEELQRKYQLDDKRLEGDLKKIVRDLKKEGLIKQ